MAEPQYNFEGIPDAPAGGYNFAGIPDVTPENRPNASGVLPLAANAAVRTVPAITRAATTALNAPNAPRMIQRAIGAGVRGTSTVVGSSVGGIPGAVAGAAMSEGLTPTQQTIRGWLGRTAEKAASSPASDAVLNYIESMGADVNNLKGAALEYAKKAGRAILYDGSGRASLVPTESAAKAAESVAPAASTAAQTVAKYVAPIGHALNVLTLAQAEADVNKSGAQYFNDPKVQLQGMQYLIERGSNPLQAAAKISDGDPKVFGALMAAYGKSRMVK